MSDVQVCVYCGETIRPNQTSGWYHLETGSHRSDQRCFLYAKPTSTRDTSIYGLGTTTG